MAMKNKKQKGFALLIAVIFMSVMLAIGLALSSLGYKQQTLASSAIESQYAFYAADAALECTLYADQQLDQFNYAAHSITQPNPISCNNIAAIQRSGYVYDSTKLSFTDRISIDDSSSSGKTMCADVTIYKYSGTSQSTVIFSQGYDVPCSSLATIGARFVSRGESFAY